MNSSNDNNDLNGDSIEESQQTTGIPSQKVPPQVPSSQPQQLVEEKLISNKPVYEKPWFWIIVAIAIIGIIGAVAGTNGQNSASPSNQTTGSSSTANTPNKSEAVESIDVAYSGSNQSGTQIDTDTPGITVTASYDDGTSKEVTVADGWVITNPATLEDGQTQTFTVEYEGKTASFTIEVPTALTRDNSTAKATALGAGTFTVGTDVQPGRYVISTVSGSGNFMVAAPDGDLLVNEILGSASDGDVPTITTDLSNGDIIQISRISQTKFTPATTEESTTLTTGSWVVGIDIPAGSYVATPENLSMSGNFTIYSSTGNLSTNEILGGSYGVPSVTVALTEGDIILIERIPTVNFTAQ